MTYKEIVLKPNFENLNTLRFFAFFAVFLSHSIYWFRYSFPNKYIEIIHRHFFMNGNLGVNFFFVLSGFLITWLLFIEKENNKTVEILAFYLRRTLRIWPIYFTIIIIAFVIPLITDFSFIINPDYHINGESKRLIWYMFFLGNFDIMLHGGNLFLVPILWSVAIEEQFYLFWPLIFYLDIRKYFKHICILIIFSSFIYRTINADLSSYFSTFYTISDLAIGSLASYLCFYNQKFLNMIKSFKLSKIILIYSLLLLFIPLHSFSHYFGHFFYRIYHPFEALIFSSFFAFIIIEQNFCTNSFYKFGKLKSLSHLGEISYGLYAYHMLMFPIAFMITNYFKLNDSSLYSYIIRIITSFFLTILCSKLSYKYLEKPFLQLKRKI